MNLDLSSVEHDPTTERFAPLKKTLRPSHSENQMKVMNRQKSVEDIASSTGPLSNRQRHNFRGGQAEQRQDLPFLGRDLHNQDYSTSQERGKKRLVTYASQQ